MDKKDLDICLEASEEEAKRLLKALEDARAGKLKKNLGEADVKRCACMLLERYYYYEVGPPKIMLQLIANCMKVAANPFVIFHQDIPTRNYEAWDRAVFFEAEHDPVLAEHDPVLDEINPSIASENAVAKAAFPQSDEMISPHRRTVKEWRKNDAYCGEVNIARYFLAHGMDLPNRQLAKAKGQT